METQTEVLLQSESTPAVLEWAIVLLKHKRFIIVTSLVTMLLTGVAAFLTAPTFEATARVISPTAAGSASLMAQISGAAAAAGLTSGSTAPSTGGLTPDMLNGFIKSSTVENAVIERMGYIEEWGKKRILSSIRSPYNIDLAREELEKNVYRTEVDSASGIVSIIVEYEVPQKAADTANTFVDELVKLVRNMTSVDSKRKKAYYEAEMKKSLDNLTRLEDDLRKFQESSGAIQIDSQAKAVLDGIATLEAQISSQEIQLKVMKTYAAPDNPDLKRAQEQLRALRDQRAKLEEKSSGMMSSSILPTSTVPSLGIEYLRKMREMKFQEAMYLMLEKQYESERMDESRDVYDIWVVDKAGVPQKKAAPKILLDMVLGGGIAFILCLMAVFFRENLRKKSAAEPRVQKKLAMLKQYLFRI